MNNFYCYLSTTYNHLSGETMEESPSKRLEQSFEDLNCVDVL